MNQEASIEIIDNITNCPVVKLSYRQFPGVVLQGDTLYSLYSNAKRAIFSLDAHSNEDAYEACEFLADSLEAILSVYEKALEKNDISLPYKK